MINWDLSYLLKLMDPNFNIILDFIYFIALADILRMLCSYRNLAVRGKMSAS